MFTRRLKLLNFDKGEWLDFKLVMGLVLINIYNEEKISNFCASNYMKILSYGLWLKVKLKKIQKSIAY
jgi:hypothetical protein